MKTKITFEEAQQMVKGTFREYADADKVKGMQARPPGFISGAIVVDNSAGHALMPFAGIAGDIESPVLDAIKHNFFQPHHLSVLAIGITVAAEYELFMLVCDDKKKDLQAKVPAKIILPDVIKKRLGLN